MPLQDAIHYAANPVTETGQDLYAVVMGTEGSDTGKIYNTATGVFEAFSAAKWNGTVSDYDIPLVEAVPALYAGSLPSDLLCPGKIYDIVVYSRAGAVPNTATDSLVSAMMHETGEPSLNLWAEAPQDCVTLGQTVTFTAYFEDENGQVAPNSGNLSASVVGAGSVVSAAIGANAGLFSVTYNSTGAIDGAQVQIVISGTKSYGDCTVTKSIAVPVKVCSSASNGIVVVSQG